MRRLFVRLYIVIGALLLAELYLLVQLRTPSTQGAWAEQLAALTAFDHAATRAMVAAADPDARQAALDALQDRFGYEVQLLPLPLVLASLSEPQRDQLQRGASVPAHSGTRTMLYVPLPAEPFVVRLGPVQQPEPTITWQQLLPFATLVLLALGMLALLRPLERDLGTLTDTARRLGEGELAARAHLPRSAPLGPLAAQFDQMAEQVQALVRSQRDLLHAVSHELRSPLQRLRFGADLMARATDPSDLNNRVRDLQRDITELDTLVDELLSWTRLQGGEDALRREPTDLEELLEDLAYNARRLRPELTLTVRCGALPELPLDAVKVRRSLGNLLSNAVRYGNSRVEVSAALLDAQIVVDVDDDGPGVPEADRERIFAPFTRLDAARARDTGGIGLGLAIAREIAEAHGGSLIADKSPLGGARFRWRLPLPAARP